MLRNCRFAGRFLLVALLVGVSARAQELAAVHARGKLVLLGFPHQGNAFLSVNLEKGPMVKVGSPEHFQGLDLELMQRFAASLGVALEVRPVAEPRYGALIPELLAGHGDLIAGGFSITEERRAQVDFSRPYFTVDPCIVTSEDSTIHAPTDLMEKIGAVLAGSSSEQRLKRLGIPAARIRPVEFGDEGLNLVSEGKADYWATEVGEGDSARAATMGLPGLKVAFTLPEKEGVGIAVRKGSDLLGAFAAFLDGLEKSGELARLKATWLGAK